MPKNKREIALSSEVVIAPAPDLRTSLDVFDDFL